VEVNAKMCRTQGEKRWWLCGLLNHKVASVVTDRDLSPMPVRRPCCSHRVLQVKTFLIYFFNLHSARNGNLEVPVFFLKMKKGYTVRDGKS
jgi:hypothetical protein